MSLTMCDNMYRERFFIILFFYTKMIYGRLLGEEKDETTPEPIDIDTLTFDEWCKFQVNTYDCGEKGVHAYRYYYDVTMNRCKATTVGDCEHNHNNFWDLRECNDMCRDPGRRASAYNLTPNVYCRFQPEFGLCNSYHPMWYFDLSTRSCKGFSYSGCGGNQNKFISTHDCTTTCIPNVDFKKW